MNAFLLELLNMSLVASLLIVAVVILRLVFKKAPKAVFCLLWGLVGLRLICPFSFESKLSLVPDSEPISHISQFDASELTPQTVYKKVVSFETEEGSVVVRTEDTTEFDYVGFILKLLPYVWAGGVGAMAVISAVSLIRLKSKLVVSLKEEGRIWRSDGIKTPFILGVIRPKIYIPSHLSEEEKNVVVAHEKAHIKRLDHIWKPLGYTILSIHWFNPLVWVAYALLCKDIELSCDEYVIKKMSASEKKLYSNTLLSCNAPKHLLTACPVAFGEVGVKARIKGVLSYKRPAFWIIIVSVLVSAIVAVAFMTDPLNTQYVYKNEAELLESTILRENTPQKNKDLFCCESHQVIQRDVKGSFITYYTAFGFGGYTLSEGEIKAEEEFFSPAIISAELTKDGEYKLVDYWTPQSGEGYEKSVKERFPANHADKVIYGVSYENTLKKANEKKAEEHFSVETEAKTQGEYPRFTGEILSVDETYYRVAPSDSNTALWQEVDEVYVSKNALYGSSAEFIEGDIVQVTYDDVSFEQEPVTLSSVSSISLVTKIFQRIEPLAVNFFRQYTTEGMEIYGSASGVEGLKVYRYMPETPVPPENIEENATYIYYDRFAPYLCLDYNTGFATFAYGLDQTIIGVFEESEGKLTIKGYHYSRTYPNLNGDSYVFELTPEGYALDRENSDYINIYRYTLQGELYEDLPQGAVFEEVKNLIEA